MNVLDSSGLMGRVCMLGDGLVEVNKIRDKHVIDVNSTYYHITLIVD
jgi:hypothetical protein